MERHEEKCDECSYRNQHVPPLDMPAEDDSCEKHYTGDEHHECSPEGAEVPDDKDSAENDRHNCDVDDFPESLLLCPSTKYLEQLEEEPHLVFEGCPSEHAPENLPLRRG